MAILVTGGAGYIGSVTVERLQEAGETVVVLDDLGRGHREALTRETPFYRGRVGDRALIAKIAGEHRLESCVHFAALAYVGESVEKPRSTSRTTSSKASHSLDHFSLPACAELFCLPRRRPTANRSAPGLARIAGNGRKIPTAGQNYSSSG